MSQNDAARPIRQADREIADLCARRHEGDYDVGVAQTGEPAHVSPEEAIDVVLLDRRFTDLPGEEVLERIRERELDCWVAMVTAVEPEFDVLEVGVEDHLVRPGPAKGPVTRSRRSWPVGPTTRRCGTTSRPSRSGPRPHPNTRPSSSPTARRSDRRSRSSTPSVRSSTGSWTR